MPEQKQEQKKQEQKPAPAPSAAEQRRVRAVAAGAQVREQSDARERYTLAEGETWHELPTGGYTGIVVTGSFESVVEVSSQGRARRGVSVLAITTLQDAERLA